METGCVHEIKRKNEEVKKMKGSAPIFVALSVLGILVGLFLVSQGLNGNGLSATLTLIIGLFVVFKEILDIFH